jgi:hypothetical protein
LTGSAEGSVTTDREQRRVGWGRRLFRLLTPGDVALIAALFVVSAASMVLLRSVLTKGTHCRIVVGDEEVGRYPLSHDRIIEVAGPLGMTTVVIMDGSVRVEDSPCPHRLCVRMGEKRLAGETVACIPNRILISVSGGEEAAFDAFAR